MKFDEYYDKIYRLEYIIRYSNVPRVHDESVASHSFFVAAIVLKLHDEYDFNLGAALAMAISHDIPEYATNDLSHETKRLYPEIKEVLKKIEKVAVENMPRSIRWALEDYQGNSVESKMVHFADTLQCHQYAAHELQLGNSGYMQEVFDKSWNRTVELCEQLKPYKRKEV